MTTSDQDPLASAHVWLHTAATELGVEPELVPDLIGDLLDLTRDVAHGPSRPAAPVTAFLVGLSAGRSGAGSREETVAEVRERIAHLTALLEGEK